MTAVGAHTFSCGQQRGRKGFPDGWQSSKDDPLATSRLKILVDKRPKAVAAAALAKTFLAEMFQKCLTLPVR